MRRNRDITEETRHTSGESPAIEERFLDEGDRSQGSIEAAAEEAFVEDQRDPDHPTHRRRRMTEEQGIEDPSHSQGI